MPNQFHFLVEVLVGGSGRRSDEKQVIEYLSGEAGNTGGRTSTIKAIGSWIYAVGLFDHYDFQSALEKIFASGLKAEYNSANWCFRL
jgi:hypothetical protein